MAAYTTVDDPSEYFQAVTYSGPAQWIGPSNITFSGNSDLQPDLLWIKRRNAGYGHNLFDTSRGIAKLLEPQSTAIENTNQTWISGVLSDGFTLGVNEHNLSNSGGTYVAYGWKVNSSTTSNLSGNLSSVAQVNAAAGISIVTYTGSGGNGQSVNHGLGLTPEVIITKARNGSDNWRVYHKSIGNDKVMKLDTADAEASSSNYSAAAVNSTAFFVSTNLIYVGELGADYVSYCFAPIQGYSKFGHYTGTGSGTSDGTFDGPVIYTGFKPAWLMVKSASASSGDEWIIWDSARPPRGSTTSSNNYINNKLYANTTAAESGNVYDAVDFLSNGFKIRTGRAGANSAGRTYIYMAFAENPFVTSTGVPATAR